MPKERKDAKLKCYTTPKETDWPVYIDGRFCYAHEHQAPVGRRLQRKVAPLVSMLDLTLAEAISLQIVDLYPPPEQRKKRWTHLHKKEVIRAEWRRTIVRTKAASAGVRALAAYDWLVANNPTYASWIQQHTEQLDAMERKVEDTTWYIKTCQLLLFSPGIEVAARPVLYARAAFGDTDLHHRLDELGHLSSQNNPSPCVSFLRKALSRLGSYGIDFMLLCLIYDIHLARTIYGVCTQAESLKQAPETVASHLSIFDSYWRHEEDVLCDMVRQKGNPQVLSYSQFVVFQLSSISS